MYFSTFEDDRPLPSDRCVAYIDSLRRLEVAAEKRSNAVRYCTPSAPVIGLASEHSSGSSGFGVDNATTLMHDGVNFAHTNLPTGTFRQGGHVQEVDEEDGERDIAIDHDGDSEEAASNEEDTVNAADLAHDYNMFDHSVGSGHSRSNSDEQLHEQQLFQQQQQQQLQQQLSERSSGGVDMYEVMQQQDSDYGEFDDFDDEREAGVLHDETFADDSSDIDIDDELLG